MNNSGKDGLFTIPDWHIYEASEGEAVIIHREPDATK